MDAFFRHENQGTFTSLSDMGDLRHGTKSKPMSCVESLITVQQKDMPDLEAKIDDRSVVVNMLSPKASLTFSDHAAISDQTSADIGTCRCCMGPVHLGKSLK